jgi:hypothetical protein
MKKKMVTTIIIVLIFLLLITSIFLGDILPREITNTYGLLIYAPIVLLLIILIGLVIFIKKYDPTKKRKSNNPRRKEVRPEPKKEIKEKPNEKNNEKDNKENKKEVILENKIDVKKLKKEREQIISELKEAENQFLKNKISKETFDKLTKDKNAKLIRIEAGLDSDKKLRMSGEDAIAIEKVSQDKKEILKGLLLEKQRKVHELRLCEKGYLKRKIDESTYKKISEEVKSEIISIEGKIKALQKSDEIEKIKKELIEGAKEITKQQKSSKKRIKAEPKTFEDQVFEQIGFK